MTDQIIYITLHATSEWNELGRCQGHCDTDLSKNGIEMARMLAQRPDLNHVKTILTSDLKRAYNTALPLAKRLRIDIITDPMLREGNWENHFVDPKFPPLSFPMPYESNACLAKRAINFMQGIAASHYSFPIFIVTHGGFLKSFIRAKFPDHFGEYKAIRTAINTIRIQASEWTIGILNDDTHLHKDIRSSASIDHG